MRLTRPDADTVARIASDLGMTFDRDQAAAYVRMIDGIVAAYDVVDALPDAVPELRYPRTAGRVPQPADNPLGAWVRRLDLNGAAHGRLSGKRIAIKDNIAIAGVPMAAGTRFLDGFAPSADATVVTRVLDAGGAIVGKANCEYLTLSGGSHTSWPAPVRNPRRTAFSAGGSSSGCAAVIAAGEADLAIGTDQGGFVRIPASWCGIVALKPTYGLVPYTGIMPVELTLDHAGPMSATVADNALLLSVLAGPDGLDPRQPQRAPSDYTTGIAAGIAGLRIGVLDEGFGTDVSEPDSDRLIREAAGRFRTLGATVDDVSVPAHRIARAIWTPPFVEGLLDLVLTHNGAGTNHGGLFDAALTGAMARWRQHADELSPSMKVVAIAGRYLSDRHGGRFYGKGQNLIRWLRGEYDRAFGGCDLLLMPTTPHKATPLPPPAADDETVWNAALGMNINTAPFCATGHPAISLPCGSVDGLPIGLMLVGRAWQEDVVYRAAHAFESAFDWQA